MNIERTFVSHIKDSADVRIVKLYYIIYVLLNYSFVHSPFLTCCTILQTHFGKGPHLNRTGRKSFIDHLLADVFQGFP